MNLQNMAAEEVSRPEMPRSSPSKTRIPLIRQRSAIKHNDPDAQLDATSSAQARRSSNTSQTWAELQNTLEEVELNAGSTATVFGAQHSRALEELRHAQVELARAWARGEEGEGDGDDSLDPGPDPTGETSAVLASDRGKIFGAEGVTESFKRSQDFKKSQLEEETENDLRLARQRRIANDRYFERVNKGVVDVVAKLQDVAEKMGGAELSSQEIWGDKESIDGGASIK